jgi:hypothetical protein
MTDEDVRAVESDLVRIVEGTVGRAIDPGYAADLAIDNGRISQRPYLIAMPSNSRDVAKIVRYCGDKGIRLTVKSGGHSAAGYCLNSEGIVVDLSKLNSLCYSSNGYKLTAGVGARWIQVYDSLQLQKSRYVVVGGGCGTVGLGGYLLGGGYSFVSRSYGLASDSVEQLEVVTSDGSIHNLHRNMSNQHEADLFWGLLGGGGGNFGVVTKVDLRLHETPASNLMMGQIAFQIHRLPEMMEFYNKWVLTLPEQMAVYGMLRRFPDPRNGGRPTLELHLNPVFNGQFSEGIAVLEPLLKRQPTSVELYAMTLPEWENFVGNGTSINGRAAYIRSAVLGPRLLDADVARILREGMESAPSQDSFVVWTHTGGKIRELDDGSSCFAHRDGEFAFELKAIWDPSSPQEARPNVEWAVEFFDALGRHSQGAYLNYIDPLLEDWQTKYYGNRYERLVKIKDYWDPMKQFHFQQAIGSQFSPNRKTPLDLSPLLRT